MITMNKKKQQENNVELSWNTISMEYDSAYSNVEFHLIPITLIVKHPYKFLPTVASLPKQHHEVILFSPFLFI